MTRRKQLLELVKLQSVRLHILFVNFITSSSSVLCLVVRVHASSKHEWRLRVGSYPTRGKPFLLIEIKGYREAVT